MAQLKAIKQIVQRHKKWRNTIVIQSSMNEGVIEVTIKISDIQVHQPLPRVLALLGPPLPRPRPRGLSSASSNLLWPLNLDSSSSRE